MRLRRKGLWLILALLVVGAAIAFYRSPDENYYQYSDAEVIIGGQNVAYCLYLRGARPPLCADLVLEPAATAGQAAAYHELSFEEVRKRLGLMGEEMLPKDLPAFLSFAALVPALRDFRLLAFQRRMDFFVMTFGYQKEGDPMISIPGKGPLLFGVTLRYVKLPDSSLFEKARRKAANLPIIAATRAGTAGRIALIDLKLNAYRTDLVEWIEQERTQLAKKAQELREEEGLRRSRVEPSDLARIKARAEASLVEAYEWAERTMDGQFRSVSAYLGE